MLYYAHMKSKYLYLPLVLLKHEGRLSEFTYHLLQKEVSNTQKLVLIQKKKFDNWVELAKLVGTS